MCLLVCAEYNCVLCSLNSEETVNHLFLECDFAREFLALVGLTVISDPDPLVRFESFKSQLHSKFYMELIIIMCWSIWTVCNDFIFRGILVSSLRGGDLQNHLQAAPVEG